MSEQPSQALLIEEQEAPRYGAGIKRAFVTAGLAGGLFGLSIGLSSSLITDDAILCSAHDSRPQVSDWTTSSWDQCYNLTPFVSGLLNAFSQIGALCATLLCFRVADSIGRRGELRIASLAFTVGAIGWACSVNLLMMSISLVVFGFGIGFGMHAAPAYLAETMPTAIRGTAIAAKEGLIVAGMVVGYLAGVVCIDANFDANPVSSTSQHFAWRIAALWCVPFALALGILSICVVPESPRFLMAQALHRQKPSLRLKAIESLARLGRSPSATETELREIEEVLEASPASASVWEVFNFKKQLTIGCGVVAFQQLTGQPTVLLVANTIFKQAGFGASSAAIAAFGVSGCKFVATMFSARLVDKTGRRPLLLIGTALMCVALAMLGSSFSALSCTVPKENPCTDEHSQLPHWAAIVSVAGLGLYVSSYQVGFGPIAWLLVAEVFPLSHRGGAISVAVSLNFILSIAVTLIIKPIIAGLGLSATFFIFLAICIFSVIAMERMVPETKGKTLEQIEEMLGNKQAREVTA